MRLPPPPSLLLNLILILSRPKVLILQETRSYQSKQIESLENPCTQVCDDARSKMIVSVQDQTIIIIIINSIQLA